MVTRDVYGRSSRAASPRQSARRSARLKGRQSVRRSGRRSGRRGGDAILILSLFGLLITAWLTAPTWARLLRTPLPDSETPTAAPASEDAQSIPERKIRVKLFMEDLVEPRLVAEERAVPFAEGLPQQVRLVVEALVRGSEAELIAPLSPETRVLDVFIQKDVAVVDLSREAVEQHGGGSISELLTVYAIVDSITANFPAIQRVQIAIDGAAPTTFAGHIDVSRPLYPDLALILPREPVEPVAEPAEAPVGESVGAASRPQG